MTIFDLRHTILISEIDFNGLRTFMKPNKMYSIPNKGIKKPKRIQILKIFATYVRQFFQQTNLQGLIYVGNPHLSLWERTYFLVWFITFICIAINFATNVFIHWDTTPVLIASESQATSIKEIPFPAITLCNMNQALRSKIKLFPKHSLGYAMTQKICAQDIDYSQFDDLKPSSNDANFTNFIWQNGPTCKDMIIYCRYGHRVARCTDFFREVLVDDGVCCAFNILHPSYLYKGQYTFIRDFTSTIGTIPIDWSVETGYGDNLPLYYYPRIPLGSGVSLGFTFVLNASVSEYTCSSTFSTGFKVIAHNPIDAPHVKDTGLVIQPGFQHRFLINVDSAKALPSLRSITPKRRQCLFNNELELHYYRYYTRRNCEMECDSEYFLRRCQCIPFHLPLINPTAKICGVEDFNCEDDVDDEVNDAEHLACKSECLPGCFYLEYYSTVFRTPLLNTSFGFKDKFLANFSNAEIQKNVAVVEIYFPDDLFRYVVRSPYTSFTDYLSQTGGIMSLMVGFGVLSIPEFFYFCLIRPILDLVLRRIPCTVRRVTGVTKRRMRKVADAKRVFFVGRQTFYSYPRQPLATGRKPLKSLAGHVSPKSSHINRFMNHISLQKNRPWNIEPEAVGLFPYTE